tara:strand:+ start:211224 stop:212429 length:1206 start_codon:yes stop_codon:yes gene_type:complete
MIKLVFNFKVTFFLLVAFVILSACKNIEQQEKNPLAIYVDSIKQEYAPDKRTALFNIEANINNGNYILKGESNLPEAVNALKAKLNQANIRFTDSMLLLPTNEFKNSNWAVIKISAANLRSKPGHSQELATQATLGTPVKVYKNDGDWYLVQTPDNYLAWVDRGGIEILKNEEFIKWKSTKKIIYTNLTGYSYESPTSKQVVSDLVAGSILELVDDNDLFYKVNYPDGRLAYIKKGEAQVYDTWLATLNPTTASLEATSKRLMGIPYLWGGTSTKGVDCSGFTKTVYFLNGMVLPRDASQQVNTGNVIDKTKDFNTLDVGDLLFFGNQATDSTKQRVVHVGMWIGNNEFIHSSGRVHISSFDKNATNYDAYNFNRYLQSNRVLKEKTSHLINLQQTPLFKD